MPQAAVDKALKLAHQAAPLMEKSGIAIDRRVLFSTIEIEKPGAHDRAARHRRRQRHPARAASRQTRRWTHNLRLELVPGAHRGRAEGVRGGSPRGHSASRSNGRIQGSTDCACGCGPEGGGGRHRALAAAGIEVDRRRLFYKSQLQDLATRFGRDLPPQQALPEAVARWLRAPSRSKVSAWSNIGDAIRAEIAERRAAA